MAIQQWDPFREAVSLRDAMNLLFQDSFVRPASLLADNGAAVLPLDLAETEKEFIVKAALPGIKPEQVQITVQGDTLTIGGESRSEDEQKGRRWHLRECRSGAFQRSLTFGTPFDADQAQAHYEHGVLTLTLPKTEEARPRQIKIGGGAPTPAQIGQAQTAQSE
jgi:HSP20 family protein